MQTVNHRRRLVDDCFHCLGRGQEEVLGQFAALLLEALACLFPALTFLTFCLTAENTQPCRGISKNRISECGILLGFQCGKNGADMVEVCREGRQISPCHAAVVGHIRTGAEIDLLDIGVDTAGAFGSDLAPANLQRKTVQAQIVGIAAKVIDSLGISGEFGVEFEEGVGESVVIAGAGEMIGKAAEGRITGVMPVDQLVHDRTGEDAQLACIGHAELRG